MILSDPNPFSHILHHPLGARNAKPRKTGFTMVIDKGIGQQELRDWLDMTSPYLDLLKLGFGTSCLYPIHRLQQKLALASTYSVYTCPGGTLGEVALHQHCYDPFVKRCKQLGFTAMEISDGTITLKADERAYAIDLARQHMDLIITEVGKKTGEIISAIELTRQILADMNAGADYVIVEGRETGENVGIYGENGAVDGNMLEEMIALLPKHTWPKLIWEAPKKSQQVELIRRFGTDVNLGNIAPSEVMAVECLRLGLRGDTFIDAISSPSSPT